MLNKLIKNELKATSRLLGPLYIILLLMSIVNRFVINANGSNKVFNIIRFFLILTYAITIIAILTVTIFYMFIRFYKNLLMDEGYLMFTLPVKTHGLVASKLLTTVFWAIISIIAIIVSLLIVFATPDTIPAIANGVKEAVANVSREFGTSGILFFVEFIALILVGMITNILLIYVSMAIGQLFSNHKIIGSFAAYMIIYTAIQFLMLIVLFIFGLPMSENLSEPSFIPKVIFPVIMISLTIIGTCSYLGINYIFKKKLNLD